MRTRGGQNIYISGTWFRRCDECGTFEYRNRMHIRWDGFIVCDDDNDPKPRDVDRPPIKPIPVKDID